MDREGRKPAGLTRFAIALGAILGPLLVLAAAWQALTAAPGVRGQGLLLDRAARRADKDTDLVVIGASFAYADIDPTLLASEISPGSPPALVLYTPASAAPIWYAILKERVYANGLEPGLIVLPVSISTAMVTNVGDVMAERLSEQMPVPDEVVARRAFGYGRFPMLEGALAARGELRDHFLHAFRDALPRWLLGAKAEAVASAGASVFGEHHAEAARQVLPMVEEGPGRSVEPGSSRLAQDPAESYLADIVDLAHAHGSAVALVLPPTTPDKSEGQRLDPAFEAELAQWAASKGVAWLDQRELPWGPERYRDGRHMDLQAAQAFTTIIGQQISALVASGDFTIPGANHLLEATAQRTGSPPALPELIWKASKAPCLGTIPLPDFAFLGQRATNELFSRLSSPIEVWEGTERLSGQLRKGDCNGTYLHRSAMVVKRKAAEGPPLSLRWSADIPSGNDGQPVYWVYPGTTLSWTLAEPVQAPATVALTAGLLGPGTGVPELRVGDARTPLEIDGIEASARIEQTGGTIRSVEVSAPAGGPFVVVQSLTLSDARSVGHLVVLPPPQRLALFTRDSWTAQGLVSPLPELPVRSEDGESWFEVPWRPEYDCSPLRVQLHGELLPEAPPGKKYKAEGTLQVDQRLLFEPLPGTNPTRDYQAVYDPDHHCDKSNCRDCQEQLWVYPGETLRVEVPAARRTRFAAPLVRLRLELLTDNPPTDGEAPVHVQVSLGEAVLLDALLRPAQLRGIADLPLDHRIGPFEEGDLRVTFEADPSLPPVLLSATFEDQ